MATKSGGKTLFVRNIPYSVTSDELTEVFKDDGPIKRCFVVTEQGSDKGKGFGYVTFSLREDAEKAVQQKHDVGGRKVFLSFADSKPKIKKGQTTKEQEAPTKEREQQTKGQFGSQKTRGVKSCTVVASGFKSEASKEDVLKLTKKLSNVTEVVFPAEGRATPTALVQCSSKKDAVKAAKTLQGTKHKGQPLQALLLSQEMAIQSPRYQKRCKLIVRNLSFKCKADALKEAFQKFGDVTDVSIPKSKDGRLRGFGFVQMGSLQAAGKAIQALNAKEIMGRPVAVDWAVGKDRYVQAKQEPTSEVHKKERDDDSDGSGDEMEAKSSPSSKPNRRDDPAAEEDGSDADCQSSSEESSDEESSEEDEESDESDDGEDESDDGEDESDDGEEESEDDEDEQSKAVVSTAKKRKRQQDVEEGKTLFIRNVSYDTEEEDLEEHLSQYGELEYCRLVYDPATEHPKGTAFVKFSEKEDAEKCLLAAGDEQGGVIVDGRKLLISLAISTNKAQSLKKDKDAEKESKDNRNLWLAREGMIRPGTQAAQGLSSADIAKRMKVETIKRQKLRNPNIFVSPTRLCLRNLPTSVDDKLLKGKLLKLMDTKGLRITECRIMRDMARVNGKGVGKSRGYGFVEFSQHEHALQALRLTNNNPDIFGEKKRLIVEFSLENKAALLAKQKRLERIQMKSAIQSGSKPSAAQKRGSKPAPVSAPVRPAGEKGKMAKTSNKMPTHWGPKVRHKPRQPPPKTKSKKIDKPIQMKEKKPKKMPKGKKDKTDSFDALVAKYRGLMSNSVNKKSSGKWCD